MRSDSDGWAHRPVGLVGGHMDLGLREIGESADVVHVEMGDDDVPDVVGAEAQRFDLPGRGLGAAQRGADNVPGKAEARRRVGAVLETEAGVDENEAVIGLDEEHVADQQQTGGLDGAAIQVVDLHRCALLAVTTR